MARRSPQTFLKRQREQKRAEKARQKLAKREARKDGTLEVASDEDSPMSDLDESANEVEGAESDAESTVPSE